MKRIAEELLKATGGRPYRGSLSDHIVRSITGGRANYSAHNLMTYCSDMGVAATLTDSTTGDTFRVSDVEGIHSVFSLLMERYCVSCRLIHRDAGVYYVQPGNDGEARTPRLTVRTLLAVCGVLHCSLGFKTIN